VQSERSAKPSCDEGTYNPNNDFHKTVKVANVSNSSGQSSSVRHNDASRRSRDDGLHAPPPPA
jgi:hypothetical protein